MTAHGFEKMEECPQCGRGGGEEWVYDGQVCRGCGFGMPDQSKLTIVVDKREFNTMLAALRYWQREGLNSSGHEVEWVASDGGVDPLSADEIDELCERINVREAEGNQPEAS